MSFDEITQGARELLDLRPDGWTASPLHDMVKLSEEVGEVAECMVKSRKTVDDLADELADVLVVVAAIALRAGIDLDDAWHKKHPRRVQKLVDRFHDGNYPSHVRKGKI